MSVHTRSLKLSLALVIVCTAAFRDARLAASQASAPQPSASQSTPRQPAAQSAQQPAAAQGPAKSPVQDANDASAAALRASIKGHEDEPASKVFKNVKFLTDVPSARFLAIMNFGYSRALGVKCEYCHDESDYSSDAKRPKRAAREMQVLHKTANDQLVKMENLQPKPEGGHFINCTTCHRGMTDPTKPLPAK